MPESGCDHESPALGLAAMRRALLDHAELLQVPVSLDVLCRLAAVRWDEAAVAVSVPIRAAGAARAQTVAAADLARSGEELQVTVGEGPSLDVLDGAGAIALDDLQDRELTARWPVFAPAAVLIGVASMAVIPMRVGAARFGVFGVYRREPGGLDPLHRAEAIALASLALDLLLDHLGAVDGAASVAQADGLERPAVPGSEPTLDGVIDGTPEIHQATGMISIQLDVDLPTALIRLRARAFAENRRLSHLAADVVSRVVRFEQDPPVAPAFGGGYDDG